MHQSAEQTLRLSMIIIFLLCQIMKGEGKSLFLADETKLCRHPRYLTVCQFTSK